MIFKDQEPELKTLFKVQYRSIKEIWLRISHKLTTNLMVQNHNLVLMGKLSKLWFLSSLNSMMSFPKLL